MSFPLDRRRFLHASLSGLAAVAPGVGLAADVPTEGEVLYKRWEPCHYRRGRGDGLGVERAALGTCIRRAELAVKLAVAQAASQELDRAN